MTRPHPNVPLPRTRIDQKVRTRGAAPFTTVIVGRHGRPPRHCVVTITRFLRIVARGWRTALVLAIFAGVSAGAATMAAPARYAATSTVYVTAANPTTASDLNQSSAFIANEIKTYAQLARSETVMTAVLRNDPELDMSPSELADTIQVVVPPESAMIRITAVSHDPVQARQVANLTASGLGVAIKDRQNPSGATLIAVNQVGVADTPGAPISPTPATAAGTAGGVALAVFVLVVLVRFLFDRRVPAPADAVRVSGMPRLAGFAVADRTGGVDPDPEAAAKLFHNLDFMEVGGRLDVIGVIDAAPGAGVSGTARPGRARFAANQGGPAVAANLALELARHRVGATDRIALVDLDLANATLHDRFSIPPTSPGISDVLGRSPFAYAGKSAEDGLDVFVAGRRPPNPEEFLASPFLTDALAELRGTYTRVVVLLPPLVFPLGQDLATGPAVPTSDDPTTPVESTAVHATLADGVLVVVRPGAITELPLAGARQALAQAGARVLGIVTVRRNRRQLRAARSTRSARAAKSPRKARAAAPARRLDTGTTPDATSTTPDSGVGADLVAGLGLPAEDGVLR